MEQMLHRLGEQTIAIDNGLFFHTFYCRNKTKAKTQQAYTHWIFCAVKCALDGSDLTVTVLVQIFFFHLLLHLETHSATKMA